MTPLYIAHRINTRGQLERVPPDQGVEIDLRSERGRLYLHHEPFVQGEDFEAWLEHFRHRTLICNVKEEGLEGRVAELLKERSISDYFFLDTSVPFLVWLSAQGIRNLAVRFSEFEPIEQALALAGGLDWVWIDCFRSLIYDVGTAALLRQSGLRTCLVSPELQRRPTDEIPRYARALTAAGISPDAICTKRVDLWRAAFATAHDPAALAGGSEIGLP